MAKILRTETEATHAAQEQARDDIKKESRRTGRTFEFTFPDSGVKLTLRKVNPFVVQQARVHMSKSRPDVPTTIVEMDGPLKGTEEEHPHDPQYIKDLKEWEEKVDDHIMQLQVGRAVVEIHEEFWQEDLADLRATLAEMDVSETLPKDNVLAYVTGIAAATPDDLQDLIAAVATRSQPTEEAIEAAKETFRPDV